MIQKKNMPKSKLRKKKKKNTHRLEFFLQHRKYKIGNTGGPHLVQFHLVRSDQLKKRQKKIHDC